MATSKRKDGPYAAIAYAAIAAALIVSAIAGDVIGRQIAAGLVDLGDWLAFVGALLGAAGTVVWAGYLNQAESRQRRKEADALRSLCRRWYLDFHMVELYRLGKLLRPRGELSAETLTRQLTAECLTRLAAASGAIRDLGILPNVGNPNIAINAQMACDLLNRLGEELDAAADRLRAAHDDASSRPPLQVDRSMLSIAASAMRHALADLGEDPDEIARKIEFDSPEVEPIKG